MMSTPIRGDVRLCSGDNPQPGQPSRGTDDAHEPTRMHRSLTGSSWRCPICGRKWAYSAGWVDR